MRPLIEEGHLYCANTPLYRYQDGKRMVFVRDDQEWRRMMQRRIDNVDWPSSGLTLLSANTGAILPADTDWAKFIYYTWGPAYKNLYKFLRHRALSWRVYVELLACIRTSNMISRCRKIGLRETSDGFIGLYDNILHNIPDDPHYLGRLRAHPLSKWVMTATHNLNCIPFFQPNIENIDKIIERMESHFVPTARTRFKGLGELNASDLEYTSMSERTRTITKILMSDAQRAAEYFEYFLGVDTAVRQQLILEYQQNIDSYELLNS
jgi:DNA gyrase subunit B